MKWDEIPPGIYIDEEAEAIIFKTIFPEHCEPRRCDTILTYDASAKRFPFSNEVVHHIQYSCLLTVSQGSNCAWPNLQAPFSHI